MNKSSIKNFAIWARNKLIADISYRAGLMGITADGIKNALPQSTGTTEFYDIGTAEPYSISGDAVKQRRKLVEVIRQKERDTDYQTAYKYIIEEVAYTWFNRLIAIRFMEVNDYLPSHIRVLSSDTGKLEPDIVTNPFDAELDFIGDEEQIIMQLKKDNQLDDLFRMLFIKQCNALNALLPALFEKTKDYTEVLLNLSVIDQEGVIYKLVHDIDEDDFNIEKGGQVEIIGWLYQYYNTEPKADVFSRPSGTKIKKEDVPAATQLFTPDWIVRYMVENSLGRLWVEGHPNDELKLKWKYYLEEAEQEPGVQKKLAEIRREYSALNPEDLKCIDPCMGSGHILVYMFDVLMQIYESQGYSQRDAVQSILQNNLYGLDIDDRAAQMAYFAVMMKARQYDRRILTRGIEPHVFAIEESNGFNRNQLEFFGVDLSEDEKRNALTQVKGLLDQLHDAKEYGSMLMVDNYDWDLLRLFAESTDTVGQITMYSVGVEETHDQLNKLVAIGEMLSKQYYIVTTNPPYMGSSNMSPKLFDYIKSNYADYKSDLFAAFILRSNEFTLQNGYYSLITQQAWMFKSSYRNLRPQIYSNTILNLLHLGAHAFDELGGEVVQTVSFTQSKNNIHNYKGIYISLDKCGSENEKKETYLVAPVKYECSVDSFMKLPNQPTAYWVTEKQAESFRKFASLSYSGVTACAGLNTSDNDAYVRLWQEVNFGKIGIDCPSHSKLLEEKKGYALYNKGGGFRKWFGNQYYIIKFDEISFNKLATIGNHLPSRQYYFKPCVTWNRIAAASSFSARKCAAGFVFDDVSPSAFMDTEIEIYTIALMNSKPFKTLLRVMNRGMKTETGNVQQVPYPKMGKEKELIKNLSGKNIDIAKVDWDSFEISWDYAEHPFIRWSKSRWDATDIAASMHYYYGERVPGVSSPLELCYMLWQGECNERFQKLKENEEELNRIFIDIYGLQDELTPEVEDKDVTVRKADIGRDIRSFISYAVGCMFGRYSLDTEGLAYAGGEWDDSKYKTFIPDADNVLPLTDEEYLEDDIVGLFCAWLKKVFGENSLEANLDFIANALGNKGNTNREVIRNYFLNDFFKDHCQTYSVTGSGKRPIYWLFDSGKQNGFKALVYLHRYTPDTIGNLRVDYLHKMQRIYESEINRMQDTIDHSTNSREVAAATKRKEKLQKQLKECREYDEKIGHLALSRIELDLDDGVKKNYRKVQTASDGKFYEVLADSNTIMAKEK